MFYHVNIACYQCPPCGRLATEAISVTRRREERKSFSSSPLRAHACACQERSESLLATESERGREGEGKSERRKRKGRRRGRRRNKREREREKERGKERRNLIFLLSCSTRARKRGGWTESGRGGKVGKKEEREEEERKERERERERERKREIKRDNFIQYNLILEIISFNKIHDINALHKYSHVNNFKYKFHLIIKENYILDKSISLNAHKMLLIDE